MPCARLSICISVVILSVNGSSLSRSECKAERSMYVRPVSRHVCLLGGYFMRAMRSYDCGLVLLLLCVLCVIAIVFLSFSFHL